MTITPAIVDLRAFRNGDLRALVELTDAADAPIDLTGYTAKMQIRTVQGAEGDPLVGIDDQAPTEDGSKITWIDRATGKLELLIKRPDWGAIPAGQNTVRDFPWDLQLTDSEGDANPYLAGVVKFSEGVTR